MPEEKPSGYGYTDADTDQKKPTVGGEPDRRRRNDCRRNYESGRPSDGNRHTKLVETFPPTVASTGSGTQVICEDFNGAMNGGNHFIFARTGFTFNSHSSPPMEVSSKAFGERDMETIRKTTLDMRTLLLCSDLQFTGITRSVLSRLQVTPTIVASCEAALGAVQADEFDVIVVDWREIDNLSDFLCAVRRSKINRQCVLVAIVRDMLDLKQSFAAGVHFLIHKPASEVQIERCLRAAYCARVAQRRKQHREPVHLVGTVSRRNQPFAEAVVVNLSEGGAGVRREPGEQLSLSAGEELGLRFALPGEDELLDVSGIVVWVSAGAYGVRFKYMPEHQRAVLQQWLTVCVERSMTKLCERIRAACA